MNDVFNLIYLNTPTYSLNSSEHTYSSHSFLLIVHEMPALVCVMNTFHLFSIIDYVSIENLKIVSGK